METQSRHPILIDPSQMDHTELVSQLVTGYRAREVEYIRPVIFSNDPFEVTLQRRLQRVQEFPGLESASIADRYVRALRTQNPDAKKVDDNLDKALNRRGQAAVREGYLKELGLTRIEQILLLRGVALAINARAREVEVRPTRTFSSRQEGLQAVALNAIHHFATNRVYVPRQLEEEALQRFTSDYASAYVAELIEREVIAENPPSKYDVCSVTRAMEIPIPFGKLLSKHQDRRLSIFTVEVSDTHKDTVSTEFHPKHITEIDETRIVELKRLQELLGGTFTSYSLFDTVRPVEYVEGEEPLGDKPKGRKKPNVEPRPSDGDQQEEEDYVVLEMSSPDENGHVETHVVAENATIGHACYALRQEIIDEWDRLTGVRFTWQNIYAPKKTTVQQFGVERFVHNPASDVPARVRQYLTQDADTVIATAFGRIFDRNRDKNKELFDDDMNPTDVNKIPAMFIQKIQSSEILRLFWPAIRQYGYKQTYVMMRAMARGEATQVVEPKSMKTENTDTGEKKEAVSGTSRGTSANDIWQSIVDAQMRELYKQ